jgi:hypothetical protein
VRKAVLADDGADDTEATIAAKAGVSSGRPQNCDHNVETVRFDGGFAMPARTYDQLFPYQQVGVKWLWELHVQRTGGEPLLLLFCVLHPSVQWELFGAMSLSQICM